MSKSYSGLFSKEGLRIGGPGEGLNNPALPGVVPRTASKSKPKPAYLLRARGKETTHMDYPSAYKAGRESGDPSANITDVVSGRVISRGEKKEHTEYKSSVARELAEAWWCGTPALEAKKRLEPTVEQPEGEFDQTDKEFKKESAPSFTVHQRDKANNWSLDSRDKPVTEAAYKAGKESKGKSPKKDKPVRVPTAKNEDPAMIHAKQIMKMAKTVGSSVYAGPLDILAAAYAKHTFHPDNIGEEKIDEGSHFLKDRKHRKSFADLLRQDRNFARKEGKKAGLSKSASNEYAAQEMYTDADLLRGSAETNEPLNPDNPTTNSKEKLNYAKVWQNAGNKMAGLAAKQRAMGESLEQIVDKFLEDTTTGDVASIALGFAPTGELDPRKKKKNKKNEFDRLSNLMAGKGGEKAMEDQPRSMYNKLARKVSGNMSGV